MFVGLVFLVTKHNQVQNHTMDEYFIDGKAVDQVTFEKLKSTLLIGEASSDITTSAGGYSRFMANDAAGHIFYYDAGQENGVNRYLLQNENRTEQIRYFINGKETDWQTFVSLKNSLTIEEFLNDEETMKQGRYIYVATDQQGNTYHYETRRAGGVLTNSLDKQ